MIRNAIKKSIHRYVNKINVLKISENISYRQNLAFENTEKGCFLDFQYTDYQHLYFCNFSSSFTGKELDPETGYSYYGARYLDHELLTSWLSVDPMANKYPSISPYAYCAWNPVNLVDPNGSDTIKVYLDNGTIEQIKTTGDHSIMYFKKGELIDSDLIKKDKCSFRTNTYDLYNIENELGKICQNEHLLCSDIKTGEQIFKKIAKIGSSVEWDYYSMKNNYGDLSSSGLADNTIHVKDEYTASTVCFWDHYHPTISSDSFYPSHLDQDHARQLKGARCTIFSDGLSMDFNNHVPSNKNMYISTSVS